ncbi:MAG: DUF6686 family protein [Sediminicola sp.]
MCQKIQVLKQTKNGCLLKLKGFDSYQLTFTNFVYDFTVEELDQFCCFLKNLDLAYWDKRMCGCSMKRKIPIPTAQSNLILVLDLPELEELKSLVAFGGKSADFKLLKTKDINYNTFFN